MEPDASLGKGSTPIVTDLQQISQLPVVTSDVAAATVTTATTTTTATITTTATTDVIDLLVQDNENSNLKDNLNKSQTIETNLEEERKLDQYSSDLVEDYYYEEAQKFEYRYDRPLIEQKIIEEDDLIESGEVDLVEKTGANLESSNQSTLDIVLPTSFEHSKNDFNLIEEAHTLQQQSQQQQQQQLTQQEFLFGEVKRDLTESREEKYSLSTSSSISIEEKLIKDERDSSCATALNMASNDNQSSAESFKSNTSSMIVNTSLSDDDNDAQNISPLMSSTSITDEQVLTNQSPSLIMNQQKDSQQAAVAETAAASDSANAEDKYSVSSEENELTTDDFHYSTETCQVANADVVGKDERKEEKVDNNDDDDDQLFVRSSETTAEDNRGHQLVDTVERKSDSVQVDDDEDDYQFTRNKETQNFEMKEEPCVKQTVTKETEYAESINKNSGDDVIEGTPLISTNLQTSNADKVNINFNEIFQQEQQQQQLVQQQLQQQQQQLNLVNQSTESVEEETKFTKLVVSDLLIEKEIVEQLKQVKEEEEEQKRSTLTRSEDNRINIDQSPEVKQSTMSEGKGDILPSSSTDEREASACCSCPFSSAGAWFKSENMNPQVGELIYWRDLKKSGAVFGIGLLLLLSFACCSIISVVAYASVLTLVFTFSYRMYKQFMQALQKTDDKHPFSEYLEKDITPSKERAHELVDIAIEHVNCTLLKLRSYFLIENIIDSAKFGVFLWCMTYIGALFNGITLIIIGYISIFSLPKLYEMNKQQIDHYLHLASTQIHEVISKVKSKLPFLKEKSQ